MRAFNLLALAGACLLLWTLWLHAARSPGMHPLGTACIQCHLAGNNTTPENARLLTASQEKLCVRCHPAALQVSHPSGIKPDRPLPAAYPADWKGDLTCSSCHQIHGVEMHKLRGDVRGKSFCLACHQPGFFAKMRDGGISTVQSSHAGTGRDTSLQGLDHFSLQCMGCHGEHGDASNSVIDNNRVLRHANNKMNHPIARNYANASRFGGFRPQAMLSKQILLPNGQISCVSCHLGYSKDHGKLVVSNQRSALCMECHDL